MMFLGGGWSRGRGVDCLLPKKRQNRKETEYINLVLVVGRLGG
jgi:hypothetical protein